MFSLDDNDLNLDLDDDEFNISPPRESVHFPSSTNQSSLFRLPTSINQFNSTPRINPIGEAIATRDTNVIFSKAVQRKFPGPAGLLPDKPPRSFNDSSITLDEAEEKTDDGHQPVLCSQSSETVFSEAPFTKLKKDLDMNSPSSPLNNYSIGWVKKRASGKGLRGRKIPFLAAIVQTIDCSSADPVASLRDPTGELIGIIHRDLWANMGDKIRTGSAIALRQVGVLTTGVTRRQVILNITMKNVVSIYCPSDIGEVSVNSVNPVTSTEIAKSIVDWQAQARSPLPTLNSSTPVASPGPSLFEIISSTKSGSSTPSRSMPTFRSPKTLDPKKSNESINKNDSPGPSLFEIISSTKSAPSTPSRSMPTFRPPNTFEPKKISESSTKNTSVSNFQLFDNDIDFNEIVPDDNTADKSQKIVTTPTGLKDTKSPTSLADKVFYNKVGFSSRMMLSQAESVMLDEVLDGVDLDDFE